MCHVPLAVTLCVPFGRICSLLLCGVFFFVSFISGLVYLVGGCLVAVCHGVGVGFCACPRVKESVSDCNAAAVVGEIASVRVAGKGAAPATVVM